MNALPLLAGDLGHALLHSLWQVSVVAALLWALLTLLHRAPPRLRHALAYLALLASVLWPGATFRARRAERNHRVEARFAEASAPAAPAVLPAAPPAPLPHLSPWLGLAWGVGVLVLGLRRLGGWLWLARLRARTAPAPARVQALARTLAARMDLRLPDLRIWDGIASPFCYGLVRTVVVLPAPALAALDDDLLEALLAHEFAHLRRLDFLFQGLQSLLELILFHHPLARWIAAQAHLERERACDEAAAAACGDARTVARALLHLEDLALPPAAPAALGAPLLTRIPALLKQSPAPSLLSLAAAGLILGGATLLAAPRLQAPARIQAPADLVRLADAAAAAEHLDPALVRAVIQVESRFNPEARSPLGALGLMQVMPATAHRLGFAHPEALEENLRIGTRFLRQLLDRYDGDASRALMAYNAGPEALDRARGEAPTEEARAYARAVLALAQRQAVEAAPAGTCFGTLGAGEAGALDLRLRGEGEGSLLVEGFQDTPAGPVPVFQIRIGPREGDPDGKRIPFSPRILFRPKVPGAALRLEVRRGAGPAATVTVPTAELPVRFTVGP